MSNKLGMRCVVSGKVQGVWFRASTQEKAIMLGLTGVARNLVDGQVEVQAYGEKEKLLLLFEWLKEGPALAKVDDVTYEEIAWEDYPRFAVQ